MTRAELLEQLATERFENTWWTTERAPTPVLVATPAAIRSAELLAEHEARLAEFKAGRIPEPRRSAA